MRLRLAAFAACVAAMLFAFPASAADRLTLDDAFARVEQAHPDLRLAGGQRNVLTAELDRASFRPPLRVGASAENALNGLLRRVDCEEVNLVVTAVLVQRTSGGNGSWRCRQTRRSGSRSAR